MVEDVGRVDECAVAAAIHEGDAREVGNDIAVLAVDEASGHALADRRVEFTLETHDPNVVGCLAVGIGGAEAFAHVGLLAN
jgi:hypothetical protein